MRGAGKPLTGTREGGYVRRTPRTLAQVDYFPFLVRQEQLAVRKFPSKLRPYARENSC